MCKCNCAEPKVKQERVFDILNRVTGDYLYDVPESKLPDILEDFKDDGYLIQDLKITQEIFIKTIWVINE